MYKVNPLMFLMQSSIERGPTVLDSLKPEHIPESSLRQPGSRHRWAGHIERNEEK